MIEPGDLVRVRMTGTIVEGHFGVLREVLPRRQRWPKLYVIVLDHEPDLLDELVHELHLKIDEFFAL